MATELREGSLLPRYVSFGESKRLKQSFLLSPPHRGVLKLTRARYCYVPRSLCCSVADKKSQNTSYTPLLGVLVE